MNKTPDIPVRSYIEAAVSDNITKFLTDMGFRYVSNIYLIFTFRIT